MSASIRPLLDVGLLQSSPQRWSWATRIRFLPATFTRLADHLVGVYLYFMARCVAVALERLAPTAIDSASYVPCPLLCLTMRNNASNYNNDG